MKIFLIILIIIGLLKIVSLFILCCIELYYKIKGIETNGLTKGYGIYIDDSWYIIPTIRICKSRKYFEVMIEFLCFQYYSCYNIDKVEPDSV